MARRAAKDLDALPNKTAARILGALDRLEQDPEGRDLDIKALSGRKPWRRMRIGNHRVIFRLADSGEIILVARVVDRKELQQAILTLV